MTTKLERYSQALEVLERRRRGASLADIAAALRISPSTVQRRLRYALEAMGRETSDEIRRQTEDRFGDVLTRAYALLSVLPPGEQVKVLNLIRTAARDVAWLNGVNVPPAVTLRVELEHEGARYDRAD